MRGLSGREQVERFMQALGQAVRHPARVYLTGGASAVLMGWRETTIDIDLTFVPETDEIFQVIARLKDELAINVELVAPSHFIPPLPGWETRSAFIRQEGPVSTITTISIRRPWPKSSARTPRTRTMWPTC